MFSFRHALNKVKGSFTLAAFLRLAAWFLIVAAGCLATTGILLVAVGKDEWRQVLPVATLAFTAGGVFLTTAGHLFSQSRDLKEAREKRSEFYLDSCVEAYEQAQKLLEDGNNDRATWIAAGRALGHANALATQVTEDAHRRVLELHRLKYRAFFDGCIRDKPPTFFYGAKEQMTMEEAAAASTAPEERNGRPVTSTVRALCTQSVRRVWEAAQWPKDYEHTDPLGPDFSKEEHGALYVRYEGLHQYVEDLGTYGSASGRRFRREKRA